MHHNMHGLVANTHAVVDLFDMVFMQTVMPKFGFIYMYLHNTTHRTTTEVEIDTNSMAPSPMSNECVHVRMCTK